MQSKTMAMMPWRLRAKNLGMGTMTFPLFLDRNRCYNDLVIYAVCGANMSFKWLIFLIIFFNMLVFLVDTFNLGKRFEAFRIPL